MDRINFNLGFQKWKLILFIIGVVFMIMPLIYSNYLAKKLSELELKKVELFEKTLSKITNTENLEEDVSFELEMIDKISSDLQIITVNRNEEIQLYNFPDGTDTLSALKEIKNSGIKPLESDDYTVYYKYPEIIKLLSYFPLLQLFLLLVYAGIGYAVFNSSRKEEQNKVWVGMAKETAHQLGTPISGMVGWIESLRDPNLSKEESSYIVNELYRDVDKLWQVADRFSKIGSIPELKSTDLLPILQEIKAYMQARASKKIVFVFPEEVAENYLATINVNLFQWVIENLIRNSLDAMGPEGKIELKLNSDDNWIYIQMMDTGKGIPNSKWSSIFKPGYTTKQRGWGLGLSLSKRIIEIYHSGKIYVKDSVLNQGTTFTIQLPRK